MEAQAKRIAELEAKVRIQDRLIESLLHYCKTVALEIAEEEIILQREAAHVVLGNKARGN